MVKHFERLIKKRPIKGLVAACPTNCLPESREGKQQGPEPVAYRPARCEGGKALKTGALREGFLQLAGAVRKSVTGLPTLS